MAHTKGVALRSYRDVIDVVERRVFRVDRWRIPSAAGLPVAAIGYFAALAPCLLVLSKAPVSGQLLGVLPPVVRLIAIPILGAWLLVSWQVDGRRPHHALVAVLRHCLRAKTLAGLRRAPAVGTRLAPVAAVTIAPSGDEPRYRSGRVRGPATVILRYPAHLAVEPCGAITGRTPAAALAQARRIRVSALEGGARPLVEGRLIRVPDGGEVVFE